MAGPEDVSLLERCPRFGGCYAYRLQWKRDRPEDVSLLERCPRFRGCYVQASMELEPEYVSLLEGVTYRVGTHRYMYIGTCSVSKSSIYLKVLLKCTCTCIHIYMYIPCH